MRQPIIERARRRERGQHPGLLLNRFLVEPATGPNSNPQERLELLQAARIASQSPALLEVYELAYARWKTGLPQLPAGIGTEAVLATAGRLIVGLGAESVLETGIRLHHTYGVPIISGSALKGLASHYCDYVWGQRHLDDAAPPENKGFRRGEQFHNLLFGTTEDSGVIRFEDAWILPGSLTDAREGLVRDVMTPHHPDWQTNPDAAPTDFDSPVPVAYVSVAGQFHVAVSWQGPDHRDADKWTGLALTLLKEALKEWGVGGKTSSGYGRLIEPPATLDVKPVISAGGPLAKRPAGTPVKVKIVAPRPKGGFDVQEQGRPQGTLTVGTPPPGVSTEVGAVVDVQVHNDEPRNPQYKWPAPAAKKTAGAGQKPHR